MEKQRNGDMEEALYYEKRCLRTREGALLFGPCGDRLTVDVLKPVPGFQGCIDFIHKMNVTELFTVEAEEAALPEDPEITWYPVKNTGVWENEEMRIRESKTITAQDVAFSLIQWENLSPNRQKIVLRSQPAGFVKGTRIGADDEIWTKSESRGNTGNREGAGSAENVGNGEDSGTAESREAGKPEENVCAGLYRESGVLRFGIRMGMAVFWSLPGESFVLEPGETAEFYVACAVGNLAGEELDSSGRPKEDMTELARRALSYVKEAKRDGKACWERLIAENESFYRDAPTFVCDDPRMNVCWKYRWYILKNSMCRPGMGRFRETVMYEGRDHRMTKEPLSPSGWEFSKLIPLSTPLQVTDLKWHPDYGLTREIIRSAFAAQDEDGLILSAYVEGEQKSYANYMIHAIWLYYLVSGDRALLEELRPAMERYLAGHEKVYGNPADGLLTEYTHSLTGKEYQPSYWYFKGYLELGRYPDNPKDRQYFTPLKRVDRSVYHYLNLNAYASILGVLKGKEQKCYTEKAEKVKSDILEKMWDPATGFFYDLHYETDEKAMVRNIVGIYPFWAGITGAEHRAGIWPLTDTEAFHTGSGFSSVSKDCPVFSPAGGWKGNYFKGRDGCVWCGPSWPYTTGIALEALGMESLADDHRLDEYFDEVLREYTLQHFRDGDRHRPYLVEHYNPVTGERLSDEADYNHSFWLDIVIRFVAGVNVEENGVRIAPLSTHLKRWSLKGLKVRGHELSLSYWKSDRPGKALQVFVDGILYTETGLEQGTFLKI